MASESSSLEYTSTWVVAAVCFVIVLISLLAERAIHRLGKFLKKKNEEGLFEALQKLKDGEGPIGVIGSIAPSAYVHLCFGSCACHILRIDNASSRGKGNNVLMIQIQQWKKWEESIRHPSKVKGPEKQKHEHHHFSKFLENHEKGYWRRSAVISWVISFFKQFYGSITKSDYIALRKGFIATHCPHVPNFDFHKYMMRTLELDFKRTVTISWYLWLFIVIFLLLSVEGWHTYFWLALLPVLLLRRSGHSVMKKHKWRWSRLMNIFGWIILLFVLDLIQFILFQNSFEIAFFFWIWSTYGFHSCIMEKLGYIVPRLVMGMMVPVLCSYSTLPLYALVSQMGSKVRKGFLGEDVHSAIQDWRAGAGRTHRSTYSAESPTTLVHGTSPTPFLDDDTTTTTMSITDTHH